MPIITAPIDPKITIAEAFPNDDPADVPAVIVALNSLQYVGSSAKSVTENRSETEENVPQISVAKAFSEYKPEEIPAMLVALDSIQILGK